MSGGDFHDVGAMFGERARARRSGKDAREIEHADVRKWSVASRQRFWVTIADANKLNERQRSDRQGLRMFRPLPLPASHAASTSCLNDRLRKVGGVPGGDGTRHGVAILSHAKHSKRRRAMVREIAMQITPASVPGGINAHDAVLLGCNAGAGKL